MSYVEDAIDIFTPEDALKLTGLSARQLAYWATSGFVRLHGSDPALKFYSLRDIVTLKALHVLKSEHKIALPKRQNVAKHISQTSNACFLGLKLAICAENIFVSDENGSFPAAVTGNYVLLSISDMAQTVKQAARDLAKRNPADIGELSQNRQVAHNALVVAGTRITVKSIEHFLEDGFSIEEILKEYPSLAREDIQRIQRSCRPTQAA